MPVVFKNPNLTDYFVEHGDASPLTASYEDAKVIALPNLRPIIDHDFWAELPVDEYPGVKKAPGQADGGATLRGSLRNAGVPEGIASAVHAHAERLLEQVLPVYEQLFAGYRFVRRKIVWRLNAIMNENMHVDAYREPVRDHFARLFINLDNQPRIWNTSYSLPQLYERFGKEAVRRLGASITPEGLHGMLNVLAFGKTAREWWDTQPRHVAYFQPGDCWAVESRTVAHQIFYGRRAVSIDFFVDPKTMVFPERHYLAVAERFAAGHVRAPRGE
jgi:hypothetical protein